MSPVHKLSAMGSLTSNKVDYPSMLAGYGDFGAMQRIGWSSFGTGAKEFVNIPQTFQDLMVVAQVRGLNASTIEYLLGQMNLTNSGHSFTGLYGDGSSASSSRNTPSGIAPGYFYLGLMPGGNATSGLYCTLTMHILNYRASQNKTVLWRFAADQNGSGAVSMGVGLFASTSPITSITLLGSNETNGAAALYGVRASAS